MAKLTLVIGNKNYSSWSLRPWLAMTMAGIAFEEVLLPLDTPEFSEQVKRYSGAGRVPILVDGKTTVWDSLAILEYLADRFPEKQLWPKDLEARAIARSVSAEMHSSYQALRQACPMNLRRSQKPVAMPPQASADVARITSLWADCRARFGGAGPFLFGAFSNADAMFAPVVTRLDSYAIPVDAATRDYMDAVVSTEPFRQWKQAALQEKWRLDYDDLA